MKIVIIVIAIVVSAISASPVQDTQQSFNFQADDPVELKQFAFKNGVIVQEEVKRLDDDDDDEDYVTYRLPNNTRPVRYDLWVKTDVEKQDYAFSGRVKIQIRAVEGTDYVTLNYRETVIDQIDLLNTATGEVNTSNLDFEFLLPMDREFVKIFLPFSVSEGSEFTLDIVYHGQLHVADDSGFYRASHEDQDTGELVWYATTKFEPHHARHLMPCYDEPQIRAPIGLEVQHDKSYHTYSNMPLADRTEVADTDYVISKFDNTPSMQTYLLAFLVSAFDFKSNKADDIEIEQRIFAKPQSIADGSADYAASIADEILRKFEEVLNVPYMLPKLDHAAITEFPSGAMENFGFITYREQGLLLYTNYTESQLYTYRKYIARLLAHEVSFNCSTSDLKINKQLWPDST
jgi:aminopeptidase N